MRRWLAILSLSFALLVQPAFARAESLSLFFYSPEYGPGNLSTLTAAFDRFLSDAGVDLRFQAFARLDDLKREAGRRPPAFVIAPDWVVRHQCVAPSVTAIAAPMSGGATSGRRVLMGGPAVKNVQALQGGSIAAALPASKEEAHDATIDQLRSDYPNLDIIAVPKDIDALLAVGFGQVDAAFVSYAQFELLSKVNPNLTASLKELGYSKESPFPKIYATSHAGEEQIAAMTAALEQVDAREPGKAMLSILGFDDAKVIAPADRERIDTSAGCDNQRRASR